MVSTLFFQFYIVHYLVRVKKHSALFYSHAQGHNYMHSTVFGFFVVSLHFQVFFLVATVSFC
jgi:hypothetical protein